MQNDNITEKGILMGCFVPPEYHVKVKVCAAKERMTLKEYILSALDARMEGEVRYDDNNQTD